MPDLWMDVDAAVVVPMNILPLIDDTDFKTIETALVYNSGGLVVNWNFVTTAGAYTCVEIHPTTGGSHDVSEPRADQGMYGIEIPAAGGDHASNDTEGFGWITGVATGILPWRGPTIGFRAAGLNNVLIDTAYSATRGLAGTALPDAAADGVGGLVISDAGGLDIDAKLANTNEVTAARMGALTDWVDGGRLDLILDIIAADTTTDIPALFPANFADLSITATTGKVSIYRPTGSVVADVGNTASTFKTDLAVTDDTYNRAWIRFTSGNLTGEVSKVTDFVDATNFISVASAFSEAPGDGDDFEIINE